MVGLEPTRCCHQRILSPHRLPFRHTGVRIAFILYYAAFVKSSVFCPQNAKKRSPAFFRPGAGPAFAAAVRCRFRLRKKIHGGGCRFRLCKEIHGGGCRFRLCKEIHGGGCRFRPRKEIHGGGCRFRLRKKIHGGRCRFRPRKEIHGGGCRSKLPIVKNAAAGGIRF